MNNLKKYIRGVVLQCSPMAAGVDLFSAHRASQAGSGIFITKQANDVSA